MKKTITNQLPPKFKNWLSFYNEISKLQLLGLDTVAMEFSNNAISDGDVRYEVNVSYVKQKCFDELLPSLPSIDEALNIKRLVHIHASQSGNQQSAYSIDKFVSSIISIKQ